MPCFPLLSVPHWPSLCSFTRASVALLVHTIPCSENTIPPVVCHTDLSFSVVESTDPEAHCLGSDPSCVALGKWLPFSGPPSFIQAAEKNKEIAAQGQACPRSETLPPQRGLTGSWIPVTYISSHLVAFCMLLLSCKYLPPLLEHQLLGAHLPAPGS